MFKQTTTELVDWMKRSDGDRELIETLHDYLILRGKTTMRRICATLPRLQSMARDCDRLGWDNFTEGRICSGLFLLQQDWLRQIGSRWSISSWSQQFLSRVLNITHRQWLYRNARLHIRVAEGLTQNDHNLIMMQVSGLVGTDPMELLPKHRYLLDWDFADLGEGSTADRQYCLARMDSALHASGRKRGWNTMTNIPTETQQHPKRSKGERREEEEKH